MATPPTSPQILSSPRTPRHMNSTTSLLPPTQVTLPSLLDSDTESDVPQESERELHVRLKLLNEQVAEVTIPASCSVDYFRTQVERVTQIPTTHQRLIYRGKLMKDGERLSTYDVQCGHTVHVVRRVSTTIQTNDRNIQEGQTNSSLLPMLQETEAEETEGILRSPLRRRLSTNIENEDWIPNTSLLSEENSRTTGSELTRQSTSIETEESNEEIQTRSLDHLYQGILTLRSVLSTIPQIQTTTISDTTQDTTEREGILMEDAIETATSPRRRQFFCGQWLDVKDTVNQWLEATVIDISDTAIHVHYHGWPPRWDEWIDFNSDRIAAFRKWTSPSRPRPSSLSENVPPSDHSAQYSPIPSTRFSAGPEVGPRDIRAVIPQLCNVLHDVMPHLEQLSTLCEADRASDDTQAPTVETLAAAESIIPLCDRLGRIFTDTASELQHIQPSRTQDNREIDTGFRGLMVAAPRVGPTEPRRSVEVHIHAIVSPFTAASLRNRNINNSRSTSTNNDWGSGRSRPRRALNSGSTNDDDNMRNLPSRRSRLALNDFFNDSADNDTTITSPRPTMAFDEDLDDGNANSIPLLIERSDRSNSNPDRDSGASAQRSTNNTDGIGVIPEIAMAEAREQRARRMSSNSFTSSSRRRSSRDRNERNNDDRGGSTFLDIMRRTLRSFRSRSSTSSDDGNVTRSSRSNSYQTPPVSSYNTRTSSSSGELLRFSRNISSSDDEENFREVD